MNVEPLFCLEVIKKLLRENTNLFFIWVMNSKQSANQLAERCGAYIQKFRVKFT